MGRITDDFRNPGTTQNTAVGTSAEQLTATSVPCKKAMLKAAPANTGVIYYGYSNAVSATTGYPLSASEESVVLQGINDLQDIWVIATVNGEDVAVQYWV